MGQPRDLQVEPVHVEGFFGAGNVRSGIEIPEAGLRLSVPRGGLIPPDMLSPPFRAERLLLATGTFPDPIRIRSHNLSITEGACRDCHAAIATSIHAEEVPEFTDGGALRAGSDALACTRCHSEVGHWTN